MICFQLFISFFQIGAFSFGGGYAAMPLIQSQVVEARGWLTLQEFTDLITISQMTPGPIAINAATFVGLQTAGFPGAIAATLGCILPSCILVTALAWLYFKYRDLKLLHGILRALRPAVVAMIAGAGLLIIRSAFFGEGGSVSLESLHIPEAVIFLAAFFLLRWKKGNPIAVMALCGAAQVLLEKFIL